MNVVVSTHGFISLNGLSVGFTITIELILWTHCMLTIISCWITFYFLDIFFVVFKSLEMQLLRFKLIMNSTKILIVPLIDAIRRSENWCNSIGS